MPWSRPRHWWDSQSDQARFRLYTRLTIEVGLAFVAVTMMLTSILRDGSPLAAMGIALSCLAAILAVEANPRMATSEGRPNLNPLIVRTTAIAQVLLWAGSAYVLATAAAPGVRAAVAPVVALSAMLLVLTHICFTASPWPNPLILALSAVSCLAFGDSWREHLVVFAYFFLGSCSVLLAMRLTLWTLDLVQQIEHTKDLEARLQVAEQRVAFARDLHDVVGRGFSAVAVKSELASRLVRAGQAERAGAEMDEVKELAITSMEETRSLVRGYRAPDLVSEVAGARSLLAAAGCELMIHGDASSVPAPFHDVAAWTVREGTTNIVKHSSATKAELTMGSVGLTLRNNGVRHNADGVPSGLAGLRERLGTTQSTMEATYHPSDQTFVLEIRWGTI